METREVRRYGELHRLPEIERRQPEPVARLARREEEEKKLDDDIENCESPKTPPRRNPPSQSRPAQHSRVQVVSNATGRPTTLHDLFEMENVKREEGEEEKEMPAPPVLRQARRSLAHKTVPRSRSRSAEKETPNEVLRVREEERERAVLFNAASERERNRLSRDEEERVRARAQMRLREAEKELEEERERARRDRLQREQAEAEERARVAAEQARIAAEQARIDALWQPLSPNCQLCFSTLRENIPRTQEPPAALFGCECEVNGQFRYCDDCKCTMLENRPHQSEDWGVMAQHINRCPMCRHRYTRVPEEARVRVLMRERRRRANLARLA